LDVVVTTTDGHDADAVTLVTEAIRAYGPGPSDRCRVFVYHKGDGQDAKRAPRHDNLERTLRRSVPSLERVRVIPSANVGREQHSCFRHIDEHYDDMADVIVFLPANTQRRTRVDFVRSIRRDKSTQFIQRGRLLRNFAGFTQPSYMGRPLQRAHPRGLVNWTRAHVGVWDASLPSSHEGAFKTSRDRVRQRARGFYDTIARLLSTPEPEAIHYTERLVALLF
tara:strand:+ start:488 stop:1156 length:669 start_codon:yes stop_codon:yes gene_type:complete